MGGLDTWLSGLDPSHLVIWLGPFSLGYLAWTLLTQQPGDVLSALCSVPLPAARLAVCHLNATYNGH